MEYLHAFASICVLSEMFYFLLVWIRVHARCMKKRSYPSNLMYLIFQKLINLCLHLGTETIFVEKGKRQFTSNSELGSD